MVNRIEGFGVGEFDLRVISVDGSWGYGKIWGWMGREGSVREGVLVEV